jgi:hypothetical protein
MRFGWSTAAALHRDGGLRTWCQDIPAALAALANTLVESDIICQTFSIQGLPLQAFRGLRGRRMHARAHAPLPTRAVHQIAESSKAANVYAARVPVLTSSSHS